MTRQEAIDMYIERFGGFPYFLFLGASDEAIVSAVTDAIENNKEIEAADDSALY